jgi:hypothetical protein
LPLRYRRAGSVAVELLSRLVPVLGPVTAAVLFVLACGDALELALGIETRTGVSCVDRGLEP